MKQIRHLHAPLCLMMTPPLHRRQAHRNSNKMGVPLTRVDACWGECARVMEQEARTRTSLDRWRHVLWVPRVP
jgi:hypothetical protein